MIHVHRAERADRLIDALAAVIDRPVDDPFAAELVAVPTRGIERWLQQELSLRLGASQGRRDGVCANVEFPFPGTVVHRALAAAGTAPADADPWLPERLVWQLLEVIDDQLDEQWLAPLRTHLRGRDAQDDATRGNRRFAAARHLADLFDRYAVHRPAMLRAWTAGDVVDADGKPLEGEAAWQALLWLHVRERLAVPPPAERIDETVARLRAGVAVPGLPPRLALFGLTALPATYLAVLDALGEHREVHLLLLHPSPRLWTRVEEALGTHDRHVRTREDDPTSALPVNPVLASWGRDAREMQLVLARASGRSQEHLALGAGAPTTLLERVQEDVRADRAPAGAPLGDGDPDQRPLLDPGDRSVQVHACHGTTRQVEVLRDAILHLLAADPTLEARDIVVLCPDIEAFAPLVEAVFETHQDDAPGGRATGWPFDLRVRLADRALRQTNPVLRVVVDLLELAGARLTASEVLDIAGREPVRRRFGFDDDALTRLEGWVTDANIRWGLHARHRAAFALGDVGANTWRAGLDRLLLGVTMADDGERIVDGTVPLDDAEDGVETAGRFAEFVDRLDTAVTMLDDTVPVTEWREALTAAARLLTDTHERDRWQHLQLYRLLDDVVDEATADGRVSAAPLSLPEVRALLEDRLRGKPGRANHRTGDLTVSTLVPMRSVPHRVVCLMGMDDEVFPRRVAPDGDDLIARDPHVGDRDPRSEDRQLLLDALLAATDCLVVTYQGRDVRNNEERPPAVPVGELLDTIDRTVRLDDGRPARTRVVTDHPLQPFDPSVFTPGALTQDGPWGFDPGALAGARAAGGAVADRPFLPGPLATETDGPVTLAGLVAFVEHPVKAFLRQRLDVSLPRGGEEPSDAIPVDLSPLEKWDIGNRLLAGRLSGTDEGTWTAVERARGTLPPGALAEPVVAEVSDTVGAILGVARSELAGGKEDLDAARERHDIAADLPDGRRLVGTVGDAVGDALVSIVYSRVKPKHRLAAWVRLLAMTLQAPERPWYALTVGRCERTRPTYPVTVARIAPLAETTEGRRTVARRELAVLADLYDRGMREPLPLYCVTSGAYARAVLGGGADPLQQARNGWTQGLAPEQAEPEHVAVLGGVASFEALLADPPCDDEDGEGWAAGEETRFGRYALRLWQGLHAHEQLDDHGGGT